MFKQISYPSLDSTNLEAKRLKKPGLCIVAHEQVAGKGRYERNWESKVGGVYVSLTLDKLPFDASLLAVVSALVVREVIASFAGEASIKWPNDILVGGKKIAGILIESIESEGRLYIVGIGINTHNRISEELQKRATTLGSVDNAVVVDAICRCFEDRLVDFSNEDAIREYSEHCITLGNDIVIEDAGEKYAGRATGVTDQGYLILQTDGGEKVMQDGSIVSGSS